MQKVKLLLQLTQNELQNRKTQIDEAEKRLLHTKENPEEGITDEIFKVPKDFHGEFIRC